MKTIIYYTSNKEDAAFEQRIVDGIMEVKGSLPVISVSQRKMDFGENICVGNVGHTYFNAFRQLLIGCEKAMTPYVVMAESDCLYPKTGYFDFTPTSLDTIYSYDNVWVLWQRTPTDRQFKIWGTDYRNDGKDYFFHKDCTHASLIYGREFLIGLLKEALKDKPMWSTSKIHFALHQPGNKWQSFTGAPIINIKTSRGMSNGTRLNGVAPREVLDYWGSALEMKSRLWKN
jgi:hypothetical protein